MIIAESLTKKFDDITAVNAVDLTIREEEVFGLIGTNGAGKSTFLRLLAGILRQDGGKLTVDGDAVFEQEATKRKLFYISDDQFAFLNASPQDMADYYKTFYPGFDTERLYKIMEDFSIDRRRKMKTFSKGMKKQVHLLVGLCSGAKYLLMDETFDGLDPVMRQAVKSLIAGNMVEYGQTPVIASHNLRELEDLCDRVGILHNGGIILSQDLLMLRQNIHRIQCVLREDMRITDIEGLEILHREQRGRVHILTVRGAEEGIAEVMERYDPVFYEIIPLTLEEIFISETEVAGYDIKSLIF